MGAAGDSSTLARKLALQGVAGLAGCSAVDIEASAAPAVSALLAGLDDMQCASVSLTALEGLVDLLPSLPATQITPLTATTSLKVRPYFDSSSEDHRAAAVSVYGALAGFATPCASPLLFPTSCNCCSLPFHTESPCHCNTVPSPQRGIVKIFHRPGLPCSCPASGCRKIWCSCGNLPCLHCC